ncbi:basic proline-rich protein-like [Canis lupus familiaris]|uniref:basic proline-rich protein-like n=1 Tax=Canis lupus familiaris TaxID=9615 RepID=UPI0018F6E257|nr:basic proline-rich protein-like [Canis lupus familiaris]
MIVIPGMIPKRVLKLCDHSRGENRAVLGRATDFLHTVDRDLKLSTTKRLPQPLCPLPEANANAASGKQREQQPDAHSLRSRGHEAAAATGRRAAPLEVSWLPPPPPPPPPPPRLCAPSQPSGSPRTSPRGKRPQRRRAAWSPRRPAAPAVGEQRPPCAPRPRPGRAAPPPSTPRSRPGRTAPPRAPRGPGRGEQRPPACRPPRVRPEAPAPGPWESSAPPPPRAPGGPGARAVGEQRPPACAPRVHPEAPAPRSGRAAPPRAPPRAPRGPGARAVGEQRPPPPRVHPEAPAPGPWESNAPPRAPPECTPRPRRPAVGEQRPPVPPRVRPEVPAPGRGRAAPPRVHPEAPAPGRGRAAPPRVHPEAPAPGRGRAAPPRAPPRAPRGPGARPWESSAPPECTPRPRRRAVRAAPPVGAPLGPRAPLRAESAPGAVSCAPPSLRAWAPGRAPGAEQPQRRRPRRGEGDEPRPGARGQGRPLGARRVRSLAGLPHPAAAFPGLGAPPTPRWERGRAGAGDARRGAGAHLSGPGAAAPPRARSRPRSTGGPGRDVPRAAGSPLGSRAPRAGAPAPLRLPPRGPRGPGAPSPALHRRTEKQSGDQNAPCDLEEESRTGNTGKPGNAVCGKSNQSQVLAMVKHVF